MTKEETTKPVRVLFIDIEGGWGGSSRSLLYLVGALDRKKITPIVWHRRQGPVSERLEALSIEHRIEPRILSIIPWHSKNWKIWLANLPRLLLLWQLAADIRDARPDILHLNYEGLVPLLLFTRWRGLKAKVVLHLRTQAPANWIYRIYARVINRFADYLIYITENERARATEAGVDTDRISGAVLYNPVAADSLSAPRRRQFKLPLQVIYLSTISVAKGAARLLEVARLIRRQNLPVRIDVYGRSQEQRRYFFLRRHSSDDLRAQIESESLSACLRLHGHTNEPECRLAEADVLIRPSIFNDPWGRDVIEAMAVGTPVIGVGGYDKFVQSGKTGLLLKAWGAGDCVEFLGELCARPEMLAEMSQHSRAMARELFDPNTYALAVELIYRQLVSRNGETVAGSYD